MFNDIFLQKGIADRMWVEPNDDWMPNRKSVPTGLLAPVPDGAVWDRVLVLAGPPPRPPRTPLHPGSRPIYALLSIRC